MAISELKLPQGVTAHEYRSPTLLADGLANDVAGQLRTAISARGAATLVVSGGRSPVAFFRTWPSKTWTGPTSPSPWPMSAGCRWNMPTAMPAC